MDPLGASASVDVVGTLCRAEQLVFALLGEGAVRVAAPVGSATAAAVADHAGWRARRWYEVLPLVDPDRFLEPSESDRRMLAVARDQIVDAATLLVVGRELVIRIAGLVAMVGERAVTPSDAPLARMARMAAVDLAADLVDLDDAMRRSVPDPDARERVGRARDVIAAVEWPSPAL